MDGSTPLYRRIKAARDEAASNDECGAESLNGEHASNCVVGVFNDLLDLLANYELLEKKPENKTGSITISFSVTDDRTDLRIETSGSLTLSKIFGSVGNSLPEILKTFGTPPIVDVPRP